jgi:hypothetical protein
MIDGWMDKVLTEIQMDSDTNTPSPQSTTGTSPSPTSESSRASASSGSSSSYEDNLMDLISNYAQDSGSSGNQVDPSKSLKGNVKKGKK